MVRWFVSDLHFAHENIIRFCKRPFKNAAEMDDALVTNWNALVKPEDHVYNLGDLTMRRGGRVQQEWICGLNRKLNGHKYLFIGNHDHFPVEVYLRAGFEKILATWRDGENVIYSHMPLHPSCLYGITANVHGHTHETNVESPAIFEYEAYNTGKGTGKKLDKPLIVPYVNVSCEQTNYRPICWDDLKVRIDKAKESYHV